MALDRTVTDRVKGKTYKMVVRQSMLCGFETEPELKMLRLGVTSMDRIRNEYITGTARIGCCGHKSKKDEIELVLLGRGMLRIELPSQRKKEVQSRGLWMW